MAAEWAPGTTIRLEMASVTFNPDGTIQNVGVGYHVLLPSGTPVASRGFTWNPPPIHMTALGKAMAQMVQDVIAKEGVTGLAPPPPPPPANAAFGPPPRG